MEKNQEKTNVKEQNKSIEMDKLIKIGHFILIIILVASLGTLAVNQGLRFYYASYFLQRPCDLCSDLNPHLSDCIHADYYEDKPGCIGSLCLDGFEINLTG